MPSPWTNGPEHKSIPVTVNTDSPNLISSSTGSTSFSSPLSSSALISNMLSSTRCARQQTGSDDPELPGGVWSLVFGYAADGVDEEKATQLGNSIVKPDKGMMHGSEALESYMQYYLNLILNHIVRGEQKEAEQIIIKYPQCLYIEGEVSDYSKRRIRGKPLQVALGAGDVDVDQQRAGGMVEMIIRILSDRPNGKEEIAKQVNEQFPEKQKKIEQQENINDLAALKKVVKAIEDNTDKNYKDALDEFHIYLQSKTDCVHTKGNHFNEQLLIEAFKLHNKKYTQFGEMTGQSKSNLFWVKVIGFIQRFLPACDAQAFCQDTSSIMKHGEPLCRSLQMRYSENYTFFPLDSRPNYRLGFNYAIGENQTWGFLDDVRCRLRKVSGQARGHSEPDYSPQDYFTAKKLALTRILFSVANPVLDEASNPVLDDVSKNCCIIS